ncbi:hypothetical protein BX667DRAFT_534492 [Coemansia mojavensis]|nr:hypothetical protein BX667DRAFT_534492 [Coemansia mojavensis]
MIPMCRKKNQDNAKDGGGSIHDSVHDKRSNHTAEASQKSEPVPPPGGSGGGSTSTGFSESRFIALQYAISAAGDSTNSVDAAGNVCPVVDRSGLSCPILCVRQFSDCPVQIRPQSDCPAGEQLCDDGSCQKSCSDVVNPCLCGMDTRELDTAYKACLSFTESVTVKHYDPSTKQEQIEFACAQAWGMVAANATFEEDGQDTGADAWSANATSAAIWGDCPQTQEPQLSFTESFCLAFYGIIGAQVVLYLLWHVYKSICERHAAQMRRICSQQPAKAHQHSEASIAGDKLSEKELQVHSDMSSTDVYSLTDAMAASVSQLPSGMMLLRGFKNDIGGLFMYYLTLLSTAGWIVLLAIIVSDYYGTVKGGVAYGLLANSNTSMAIFVFIWHLAAVWLVMMLACKQRLRNYFRIECMLAQARVIQVEERQEEVIMTEGNQNRLTRLVTNVRNWAVRRFGLDIVIESCNVQWAGEHKYIEYRCTRYVFSDKQGIFESHAFDLGSTHQELLACQLGLDTAEAQERLARVGENFIRVQVPSFPVCLMQELFTFVYAYQMLCFWVWFYFNYYKMGLVQLGVILISANIKVFIRLRSERRVKKLAERRSTCRVRRDGRWSEVDTADLVPGDVLAIEAGMEMMCDGCVLHGETIVDESSLTGEAMPVRKLPLKNDATAYDTVGSGSKAYSVYAGTRVVQCTGNTDDPQTLILVLRSRTATDKGKQIRRILFPVQYSFVLDEQLRVSILVLLAYSGVGFGLSIWLMGHDLTSWLYGTFVVSQTLPPLLPAALVVGQSVAADRLRRQQIYCIDLPRITAAGKARILALDKTGTLTKEGLEYYAVQPVSSDSTRFDPAQADMAQLPELLQMGLATCHAATKIDGQFIGNPVDMEQAINANCSIAKTAASDALDTIDLHSCGLSLDVVKRFEFEHARQSMSVAIRDPRNGHIHVFIKGSYERIKHMAQVSLADYDATAVAWAKQGCYVLALAHRDLGPIDISGMSREKLESGCNLQALLLFRNQLKEDTAQAIAELRAGGTRTIIVTGDTAMTAAYIARECGMVAPEARIVLAMVEDGKVVWRDTETDMAVDDIGSVGSDVELAVTEEAFNLLAESNQLRQLLLNIRIFARMTPQGKVACVQLHMERAVTAMCGDGGNDTGALRAAHVGIALAGAEASIVSPFSSSTRSVRACVTLLREGRAGLATSLAAFKFLINYATTMSMLEIVQFYFSVIVPQAVWIMVDSIITVGLCISVTQAKTARQLAPSRPTARLIGAHTLSSIWGQTFINYAFLYGMMGLLFRQSWFRCHEFDSRDIDTSLWWLLGDNYEAEVISIVCLFQFVNAAGVYNFGYRYRRAWITNIMLVVVYCACLSVISALTLADPNRFGCLFRINCGNSEVLSQMKYHTSVDIKDYNSPIGHNVMPRRFRWTLWALCMVNIVSCLAYEKLVVLGPVGRWIKNWWLARRGDSKLCLKL